MRRAARDTSTRGPVPFLGGDWASGAPTGLAFDSRDARTLQAGPGHDPVDLNVHGHPHPVVLPQPAVPEPSLPSRSKMRLGLRADPRALFVGRLGDDAGAALDEHVGPAGRRPVLTWNAIATRGSRSMRSSFLLKPSEVVKPMVPASRSRRPIGATACTTTLPAGVR